MGRKAFFYNAVALLPSRLLKALTIHFSPPSSSLAWPVSLITYSAVSLISQSTRIGQRQSARLTLTVYLRPLLPSPAFRWYHIRPEYNRGITLTLHQASIAVTTVTLFRWYNFRPNINIPLEPHAFLLVIFVQNPTETFRSIVHQLHLIPRRHHRNIGNQRAVPRLNPPPPRSIDTPTHLTRQFGLNISVLADQHHHRYQFQYWRKPCVKRYQLLIHSGHIHWAQLWTRANKSKWSVNSRHYRQHSYS